MTQRDDLTPEEDREVSRLLADAATPTALPPDVAARLDDQLAGLVAERVRDRQPRADLPGPGDVATLPGPAQRRRRWPRVLVAAAAVAVVGYAGSTLGWEPSPDADQAVRGAEDAGAVAESQADTGGGVLEAPGADRAPGSGQAESQAPRSTREAPVPAGVPLGVLADVLTGRDARLDAHSGPGRTAGTDCATPELGPGDRSEVLGPAGRRVVLVHRAAAAGAPAVVTVYACGQPHIPLRTAFTLGR
jgi:hypothetical protein